MTGLDLVSASLRKIGALASGEDPDSSSSNDALAELNRMIDTWSTQGLLIYSKVRETFTLSGGTSTYSMGTGATLNTTRPMRIVDAAISISGLEYPMRIITVDEYARIRLKSIQGIPGYLYPEGTYPNETLNLYPVPTTDYTLVTYSWKPLASVSALTTVLSFPPGYEDALIYNLALRLAPEYGKPLDQAIIALAESTLGSIKRMNSKPQFLYADNALVQMGSNGRPMSIQAFNSGDF